MNPQELEQKVDQTLMYPLTMGVYAGIVEKEPLTIVFMALNLEAAQALNAHHHKYNPNLPKVDIEPCEPCVVQQGEVESWTILKSLEATQNCKVLEGIELLQSEENNSAMTFIEFVEAVENAMVKTLTTQFSVQAAVQDEYGFVDTEATLQNIELSTLYPGLDFTYISAKLSHGVKGIFAAFLPRNSEVAEILNDCILEFEKVLQVDEGGEDLQLPSARVNVLMVMPILAVDSDSAAFWDCFTAHHGGKTFEQLICNGAAQQAGEESGNFQDEAQAFDELSASLGATALSKTLN